MADDNIKVTITADDSGFSSALDEASSSARRLGSEVRDFAGTIEADTKAAFGGAVDAASGFAITLEHVAEVAAGIAGGLELYAFGEKIRDAFREATIGAAEWVEQLEHMSLVTGISVAQLQRLQDAAQLTGTEEG